MTRSGTRTLQSSACASTTTHNLRRADSASAEEAYDLVYAEGRTGLTLGNGVFDTDIADSARDDVLKVLRDGGKEDIDFGPGKDWGTSSTCVFS